MFYTWGGSSVEHKRGGVQKAAFQSQTEVSFRKPFFSHRTETDTNYTGIERQIEKNFEKWFGLWHVFGLGQEGPGLGP